MDGQEDDDKFKINGVLTIFSKSVRCAYAMPTPSNALIQSRSCITCRVPPHHAQLPSISPKNPQPRESSILILIVPLTLLFLGFLAHPVSALQPLPHALPSS